MTKMRTSANIATMEISATNPQPIISTSVTKANGRFYYLSNTTTLHRDDGPAVEWGDGTRVWYKNGKRHREGGPALEFSDGTKIWMQGDEYHRPDGPAVELASGQKEFYLRGKKFSKVEFEKKITAK